MSRQIKEKLDKLDTLSGGIVFGKDEAWEKLQARMDKKPSKKIPLRFWLTAAAILLLFVCIGVLLYTPEKETLVANTATKIENADQQPASTPVAVIPDSPQPAIKMHTNTINRKPAIKKQKSIQAMEAIVIKCKDEEVETEVQEPKQTLQQPVVAVAAKKPMRIVHVNELEDDAQQMAAVKEMKVQLAEKPRHTNIPFLSSPVGNITDHSEARLAQNPLKLKLNFQN